MSNTKQETIQQSKIQASVFIISKNEEHNIARVLDSCKDFDEIILVDSGSTDKTLEIAKQYPVTIIHNDWPGYAKQKAYAMSLCKHEWVLNLDADEELTPELIAQFKKAIRDDNCDAIRCQRNDIFINQPLSPLTKKPNNCRFYRKSAAHFDTSRLAHERADITGKERFIKEAFNHYGYPSIESITYKNNLYSSFKADEKFAKGKSFSLLKIFLVFPLIFIKTHLLQRHIFSGRRGFILSIMTSYYLFIKEAKLYEHHKSLPIDLDTIPDRNHATKELSISSYLVTLNEEKFLASALSSIQAAEEIILVDSGSDDKTLDIAHQFNAKTLHHDWPGYAKQKQFAMQQCSNSWVYSMDPDEVMTHTLWSEISDFIEQDEFSSLRSLRNDYFLGKPLSKGVKLAHNNRLFKKELGEYYFHELAHENPKVKGKEKSTKNYFYHLGYNNITELTDKLNNYSSLKANERSTAGKRSNLIKLSLVFPLMFLKNMLINRYFLMGTRGFILSIIYSYYSFIKEAKLYEAMQNAQPPQHDADH